MGIIIYNILMPFTTFFIDLDDTLYPSGNGLWNAIRERMSRYMWEEIGLPKEQVPELRRHYFETYGTTLRGLQIHHQVDASQYLAYVHNLPLENFLRPDPELRDLLFSLPQAKWIFTNSDYEHAQRVLRFLDLGECFAGIIDLRALKFACKPEPEAYRLALQLAGESNPAHCLMADDSPRNLEPAHALGFTTILVGVDGSYPAATFCIPSLHALRKAMPELWLFGNGSVHESS